MARRPCAASLSGWPLSDPGIAFEIAGDLRVSAHAKSRVVAKSRRIGSRPNRAQKNVAADPRGAPFESDMTDSTCPNWQPFLDGETLKLRPLLPSDFEALFDAGKDPAIWEQHSEPNRHELPVFRRFLQGALDSLGGLVVIDRKNQRVIGSSRYYDFDREESSVVIGYTFLVRAHWGGASNREMKNLMLAHAFQWVDTVWFQVSACNLRSKCALERLQARFDRIETVSVQGVPSERQIYRIDKNSYAF